MDASARFIGWDLVCLGRPASNDDFDHGQVRQRIQLYKNERLIFNEQLQLTAGSALYQSRVGFDNNPVFGTLVACAPNLDKDGEALVESLRADLDSTNFSVTLRLGVLLVRYLGSDMNTCRAGMWQAWALIRPIILDRPACIPRIWLT